MNADEWDEIRRLHRQGSPIKHIAVQLGMSRNTVRRALTLDEPPSDHRSRRGSVVDPVDSAIRELIADDPDITIAEIARRIQWDKSRTTLARRVTSIRAELSSGEPHDVPVDAVSAVPSIPVYGTSFVGRRTELLELRRLLGDHRLVTITGPGGMGKTRLAIHAAVEYRRAFPDGVRVIELAALRSPDLLTQTVVDGLALANRDMHASPTENTIIEYLRTRRMLLILDNCEHLLDECAQLVSVLLRSTTDLRIVTTSREILSVPDEFVFPLPPLPTVNGTESSTPARGTGSAVELFVNRAAAVLSKFELTEENRDAVMRVCDRLDGLPLAIELACARLPVLSVHELADRLDHRLNLLTTGNRTGPQRHRSLQATMDWSYELCTREQQLLWSRVSIFAGGFDLGMAEEVCSDADVPADTVLDGISALVGKSILHREEGGTHVRFRMLESIREYGNSKLTAAEMDTLTLRHLRWCTRLVTTTADNWFSADQRAGSEKLRRNRANIRSALHAALLDSSDDDDVRMAADMVSRAWFLWSCGFSVREHRMWLNRILERETAPTATRGRMLVNLGLVQTLQGDRASADSALTEASAVNLTADDAITGAFTADVMGLKAFFAGDFDEAERRLTAALEMYEEIPDREDLAHTLRVHLGMLYCFTDETARATELFETVNERALAVGESWLRSYAVYGLGLVALMNEEFEDALRLGSESLRLRRDFDDVVGTTLVTDLLGWAEAEAGSAERSAVLLGAASSMWESFGMQLYGSSHWVEQRTRFEKQARKALGDDQFEKCHTSGAAMSVSEITGFVLGESLPSSDPAPVGVRPDDLLSPREQEVAAHVAAGMTNKEIAAKLVLSPRTVEGHVEHILEKLGMSRRHEIAAAFAHAGRGTPG
ncbi:LuxR C-terminal-related transcriptional regulator [Rhodococcus sp. T2V]|uniref:LuxR C-terminal-related transcriptional regulator n=1 Tax=Rhodococcus sp. T2V TaxID=3034164 RepID=UPI0023E16FF3|nr:LuxR C-terminal-related transcriptional regulator [Rhodococcus sp. T2V]MDF3310221.1 LuxR C-terminal-related transcriptional regulator [Rhodococcus sp. T2V]